MQFVDNTPCLIGDVGGTNVRLELVLISSQNNYTNATKIKSSTQHTWVFPSFDEFIGDFLKDVPVEQRPLYGVVGIAGPIVDNSTEMANTKWPKVFGKEIGLHYGFHLTLINDFQSVAYGILGLSADDLIPLNDAVPAAHQVITVCGPGTGLGVARLFPVPHGDKTQYQVWPCEGGHVEFAPSNDLEIEYLQYLRQKLHLNQIVAEKGMAGPSIPYMYNFLKSKFPTESQIEKDISSERFAENTKLGEFPSSEVFKYGVEGRDEICQKVVHLFLSCYGTVIGDLICNTLPFSGMYLFGGISVAVANYIKQHKEINFMQEFVTQRPHMKEIFSKVPVLVIKKVDLGLEGSYQAALRVFEERDLNVKL